jgi:hypothetical protein
MFIKKSLSLAVPVAVVAVIAAIAYPYVRPWGIWVMGSILLAGAFSSVAVVSWAIAARHKATPFSLLPIWKGNGESDPEPNEQRRE